MGYQVIVNGVRRGKPEGYSKDKAEEMAEAVRYQHDYHTQVLDPEGNVVAEFEV